MLICLQVFLSSCALSYLPAFLPSQHSFVLLVRDIPNLLEIQGNLCDHGAAT